MPSSTKRASPMRFAQRPTIAPMYAVAARYSAGVSWPSRMSPRRPARSGACHETSVAPRSLIATFIPCALRSVKRRTASPPGNAPQGSEVSRAAVIMSSERKKMGKWRSLSGRRGAHALLILARRAAELPLEYRVHVLQRCEAAADRNLRARRVALREQRLRRIELVAQYLLVHGALQFAPEILFERRTRHADIIGDLLGLDPLARVLADEVARPHHIRARERLVLGRLEHVDADRRHENAPPRKARPAQHLMQQMRRRAPHLIGSLNHRRQRDARQSARERVVVDTDDRHLLRHRRARGQARLQQLPRTGVGDR